MAHISNLNKYRIVWKVSPPPTGRYRLFEETREWPEAFYNTKEGNFAGFITCEDNYSLKIAKSGKHKELTVYVSCYRTTANGGWETFTNRKAKKRCSNLTEAKELLEKILLNNPDYRPRKYR